MNKNMEFVRKNVVLIAFLVIGFVATIILGCMWYGAYSNIAQAMTEIQANDEQLRVIYARRNPVAVQGSTDVIRENEKKLDALIVETRRHFGFPYRKAFKQTFIPKLHEPFSISSEKGNVSGENGLKRIRYTEDELLQIFKKIYDGYYDGNNRHADTSDLDNLMRDRESIYTAFRTAVITPDDPENSLSKEEKSIYETKAGEVFDNAVEEFRKKIQPDTLEQVDKDDVKHILMDAMGLPRMMSNLACKGYIEEIRSSILRDASVSIELEQARKEKDKAKIAELEKKLAGPEIVPGMRQFVEESRSETTVEDGRNGRSGSSGRLSPEQKIDMLVYENPANQLPPSGNIVHILNHYKIVEDVYKRMNNARILRVNKFSRSTPLDGNPVDVPSELGENVRYTSGSIRYYEYTIVLESSVPEIQKFLNNLHDAYSDYRVYVIQSVSIDDGGTMIGDAKKKLATAESEIKSIDGVTGAASQPERASLSDAESAKLRLNRAFSNDMYGKVLLGRNTVTAKIVFSYLVYVDDQLEKMR